MMSCLKASAGVVNYPCHELVTWAIKTVHAYSTPPLSHCGVPDLDGACVSSLGKGDAGFPARA